ncbi:MAG TPA: nuclear transport factor 2 family protein [Ktedonobacterales bacterium]|nr:nuclear transport factor 2 family protein [Ktedonobacterales bacterium]
MGQIDRASVQRWLDAYVQAWRTYDPAEISALFSEDAAYYYGPYDEPVRGRDTIAQSWVEEGRRDPPGTYDAHYAPLAIESDLAITNGRSRYFQADGTTLKTEFDNIFQLRFNDAGECVEFHEWYMERPRSKG